MTLLRVEGLDSFRVRAIRQRMVATIALSAMAILFAWPAEAQSLRGRIVDDATSVGIASAFVTILDVQSAIAGSVLTGGNGSFQFKLSGPGNYSVRVQRLGFADFVSAPFTIGAGTIVDHEFRLAMQPVSLGTIEIRSKPRCDMPRPQASEAVTIWKEARKALTIAAWFPRSDSIVYSVTQYTRTFDAGMKLLKADTQFMKLRAPRGPFASIPVDSLLSRGFVQPAADGRGWLYFAPDSDVLLSEAFLDNYCFHAQADRRQPHLVGLEFRPVGPEEVPGIEGTIWLDRTTFELKHIEFSFTRIPFRVNRPAGGRIEFRSIEGGGSLVDRWSMRVPVLRDPYNRVPIRNVFLMGFTETVRVISAVTRADGSVMRFRDESRLPQ